MEGAPRGGWGLQLGPDVGSGSRARGRVGRSQKNGSGPRTLVLQMWSLSRSPPSLVLGGMQNQGRVTPTSFPALFSGSVRRRCPESHQMCGHTVTLTANGTCACHLNKYGKQRYSSRTQLSEVLDDF